MDTGENFEVNAETLVMSFFEAGTFPTTKSSETYQPNSLLQLISATTSQEREIIAGLSTS